MMARTRCRRHGSSRASSLLQSCLVDNVEDDRARDTVIQRADAQHEPEYAPAAVSRVMRRLPGLLVTVIVGLIAGCASQPPSNQHNICSVFEQHPEWYDYARDSEETWGTPAHILMAFVRHESSYQSRARPPYEWFLFIPLGRPSSARGFAQIQDPVWREYKEERGGWFRGRSDMQDALDFVGWYNDKSNKRLGISKWDPENLYLAYHEGHAGYRRGSYKSKPQLLRIAARVDQTAREYGAQLRTCDERFRCRKWYQFGPFCS